MSAYSTRRWTGFSNRFLSSCMKRPACAPSATRWSTDNVAFIIEAIRTSPPAATARGGGGFRRVDDRDEFLHVEHPQVGYRERPGAQVLGTQPAGACALAQLFGPGRDLTQRFPVRIAQHGGDQPVRERHRDADVDPGMFLESLPAIRRGQSR